MGAPGRHTSASVGNHVGSSNGREADKAGGGGESTGTVIVAIVVNAVIMVAKIAAGVIAGSAAMLSEGAHSVADTLNEGFLYTALRRSERKADEKHPFGYGKERFFWTLIAAVGIFVAGAGFSFLQAWQSLREKPGAEESYLIAYVVLAVSFVLEVVSWVKAARQVRSEARAAERGIVEHVRKSSDPTVKTVASEDTAALVGIALATLGLVLHQLTGSPKWEGYASAAIGVLLCFVAWALARDSKGLLIGEAVDEDLRRAISDHVEGRSEVDTVYELLTMRLGTHKVLVAVRLSFVDGVDAATIERASDEIARDLCSSFAEVEEVFLDPTGRVGASRRHPLDGDGEAYPSGRDGHGAKDGQAAQDGDAAGGEPRAVSRSPR